MGLVPQMLTFVNKGTGLVKNSQKSAYVIYERPLICQFEIEFSKVLFISDKHNIYMGQ